MKMLLFLIPLSFAVLMSCDGRERAYKSSHDILRDSNVLESFSEHIKFSPQAPIEIFTDTILSSGFQVKLKYYSLENDFISKVKKAKSDSVIHINYKNFEAKCQVLKNGKIITEQLLDKRLFSKFESPAFWKNAIMHFVWIDYNASTEDYINLKTSFCIPETESCKDFSIKIDEFGNIEIKEINLVSKVL